MKMFPRVSGQFLGIVASFAFVVGHTAAEVPKSKLDTLANDIEQALKNKATEDKEWPSTNLAQVSDRLLRALRSATAAEDLFQLQNALEQLVGILESERLRQRCLEAAAEVRTWRGAKDTAALAEMDKVVKRAADAVRDATHSWDLDSALFELNKLRREHQDRPASAHLSAAFADLDQTIRFVTYWQNYIAQAQGGDNKAAQETLGRMAELPPTIFIPRSEILARRYGFPRSDVAPPAPSPPSSSTPIAVAPFELKTPEDLAPAIEKLTGQFNNLGKVISPEKSELQSAIAAFTNLANAYAEFKAGLATKLDVVVSDPARPDKYGALLAPVRAQVIKLVLPRYLGLPPELTPNKDEGVQEFLDRVGQHAVKKGNFLLAARARETQVLLREGKAPQSSVNLQAAHYVTAHNQEVAGQYALAVASYEQALATGTDLVPAKVIGENLARIKAEHPEQFAQGVDMFLTPRLPQMPPELAKMFPSGPGPVPRPQPPVKPTMRIPPSSPSPTTAESPAASP